MYDDPIFGHSFDVAVIGAGASGTLVAAQFERLAPRSARLLWIGEQPRPARGRAYDTSFRTNVLNVPAGNMSAFPDDREHFIRWLATHLPGSSAATFAPRMLYGDYLLSIFEKLCKDSERVNYLNNQASEMDREDGLWMIRLDNGKIVRARSVVLALGNFLLPSDPIDFSSVQLLYRRNPWSEELSKNLPLDTPVLLIGSGLTMVDVALSLRESGHCGTIHAISRHGRLPQAHTRYEPRPLEKVPEAFNTPQGALHWIRKGVKTAEARGSNWRAVIDSLRPYTASIWQRWDLHQRGSFLRHARNLWDIHRHRMAPDVAKQLSILTKDRDLIVHAGRLLSAQIDREQARVVWKDANSNETKALNVARIINCTGPSRDFTNVPSSLVAKLLMEGWVRADPLRLGLETDSDGRLLDTNGQITPGLYALGPVRIAGLWESIAMPEIREQALQLAALLATEHAPVGNRFSG